MSILKTIDLSTIKPHGLILPATDVKFTPVSKLFKTLIECVRAKLEYILHSQAVSADAEDVFAVSLDEINTFTLAEYSSVVHCVNTCINYRAMVAQGKITDYHDPGADDFVIPFLEKWKISTFPLHCNLEVQVNRILKEKSTVSVSEFLKDLFDLCNGIEKGHNYSAPSTNSLIRERMLDEDETYEVAIGETYKMFFDAYYFDEAFAVTPRTIKLMLDFLFLDDLCEGGKLPVDLEMALLKWHGDEIVKYISHVRDLEKEYNEGSICYRFSEEAIIEIRENDPHLLDIMSPILNDDYFGKIGVDQHLLQHIFRLVRDDLNITTRTLTETEQGLRFIDLCDNAGIAYKFEVLMFQIKRMYSKWW